MVGGLGRGFKRTSPAKVLQEEEHFLEHRKAISRKFTCSLVGPLGWGYAGLRVELNTQAGVSELGF